VPRRADPLLLNSVMLDPGGAIFLSAGNSHAYLCGIGLQVIANSDNMLRDSMSAKHAESSSCYGFRGTEELVEQLTRREPC
jgi:mannose-6-phosphate isomerase